MSLSTDSHSSDRSNRIQQAILLSEELQQSASDAENKLVTLRKLLDECRADIRRQESPRLRQRLHSIDKARNYLHFLPSMEHDQATGRLRSVSKRLKSVLRA